MAKITSRVLQCLPGENFAVLTNAARGLAGSLGLYATLSRRIFRAVNLSSKENPVESSGKVDRFDARPTTLFAVLTSSVFALTTGGVTSLFIRGLGIPCGRSISARVSRLPV